MNNFLASLRGRVEVYLRRGQFFHPDCIQVGLDKHLDDIVNETIKEILFENPDFFRQRIEQKIGKYITRAARNVIGRDGRRLLKPLGITNVPLNNTIYYESLTMDKEYDSYYSDDAELLTLALELCSADTQAIMDIIFFKREADGGCADSDIVDLTCLYNLDLIEELKHGDDVEHRFLEALEELKTMFLLILSGEKL